MDTLVGIIILLIWLFIGLLNVAKKRAEMQGSPEQDEGKPKSPATPPLRPRAPQRRQPTPERSPTRPATMREVPTPQRPVQRTAPSMRQPVPHPKPAPQPVRPTRRVISEQERLIEPPSLETPGVFQRQPLPSERPARRRRVARTAPRKRFQFSENPLMNAVIASEILGKPVAKRPFLERKH